MPESSIIFSSEAGYYLRSKICRFVRAERAAASDVAPSDPICAPLRGEESTADSPVIRVKK